MSNLPPSPFDMMKSFTQGFFAPLQRGGGYYGGQVSEPTDIAPIDQRTDAERAEEDVVVIAQEEKPVPKDINEAIETYPEFFNKQTYAEYHIMTPKERTTFANNLNKLGVWQYWDGEYQIWKTEHFRPLGIRPRNKTEAMTMYPRMFQSTTFPWFHSASEHDKEQWLAKLAHQGVKQYWMESYEQWTIQQEGIQVKNNQVVEKIVPAWQYSAWMEEGWTFKGRSGPQHVKMVWKKGGTPVYPKLEQPHEMPIMDVPNTQTYGEAPKPKPQPNAMVRHQRLSVPHQKKQQYENLGWTPLHMDSTTTILMEWRNDTEPKYPEKPAGPVDEPDIKEGFNSFKSLENTVFTGGEENILRASPKNPEAPMKFIVQPHKSHTAMRATYMDKKGKTIGKTDKLVLTTQDFLAGREFIVNPKELGTPYAVISLH